jgi:4-hydroxy-tetrahydrodipicolinate reductase
MIRVIVTGAAGRMGRRVITQVAASPDLKLVGAIEYPGHPQIGQDAGERLGLGRLAVPITAEIQACLPEAEVVIDFTNPEVSLENLRKAALHDRAIVIGSTGFSAAQKDLLQQQATKTRCVFAPNMSVGVNVLMKVLELTATLIGHEYDMEIMEVHHNQKKDAPSGTALKMAEVLAQATDRNLAIHAVYHRQGFTGIRRPDEIGIQTLRAGDIVGEHTVYFAGPGERLEFIHRAHSRDNFAVGALRAARWLLPQKLGLYDMMDVLGLKNLGRPVPSTNT